MFRKMLDAKASCLLVVSVVVACQSKGSTSPTEPSCGGAENNESTAGAAGKAEPITGDGTCDSPILLGGSRVLEDEDTGGARSGVSAEDPRCLGAVTAGAERVYQIKVPASSRNQLSVLVTPNASAQPEAFDPVVYLTTTCDAQPVCLLAMDTRGGGSPESFVYTNETDAAEELFIVVDGYGFQSSGGNYQLKVELMDP